MSLVRPILIAPPAFDGTQVYVISFSVGAGGSQVTQNQLTIRNNSTNVIVYQETQTTFQYTHTIPADTLTNGTSYNATVSTFDATGEQSAESIPVQFWCYTTPVIAFSNIPTGNIIPNASFNFQFSYTQAEGEAINTFEMNLYNSANSLISTSGLQYTSGMTPPYGYIFAGFEDNSLYYIELLVTTVNNTIVSTGKVQITIKYSQPSIFTLIELSNNCDGGYVTIKSNVTLIEGTSNPSPPVYITDSEVDLTATGSWVNWNQGYIIVSDNLDRIWFRNPNPNTTILTFSNTQGQAVTLRYCEGYVNDDRTTTKLAYITATATSIEGNDFTYFIYSDYIPILPSEAYYCLWLTRINDIYQLRFEPI